MLHSESSPRRTQVLLFWCEDPPPAVRLKRRLQHHVIEHDPSVWYTPSARPDRTEVAPSEMRWCSHCLNEWVALEGKQGTFGSIRHETLRRNFPLPKPSQKKQGTEQGWEGEGKSSRHRRPQVLRVAPHAAAGSSTKARTEGIFQPDSSTNVRFWPRPEMQKSEKACQFSCSSHSWASA